MTDIISVVEQTGAPATAELQRQSKRLALPELKLPTRGCAAPPTAARRNTVKSHKNRLTTLYRLLARLF
jgi:hypothetical protein